MKITHREFQNIDLDLGPSDLVVRKTVGSKIHVVNRKVSTTGNPGHVIVVTDCNHDIQSLQCPSDLIYRSREYGIQTKAQRRVSTWEGLPPLF